MIPRSLPLLAALLLSPGLYAQDIDLKLDRLAPLAKEHAIVDLTADQIKAALAAAPKEAGKVVELQDKLKGVESVHVRTFEFDKEGVYTQADLDPIRTQLKAPGWSKVISVKEKDETVEVYMLTRDAKAAGFAVLAAEPKELTVVHIVGALKLNDLQAVVNSNISFDMAALSKQAQESK